MADKVVIILNLTAGWFYIGPMILKQGRNEIDKNIFEANKDIELFKELLKDRKLKIVIANAPEIIENLDMSELKAAEIKKLLSKITDRKLILAMKIYPANRGKGTLFDSRLNELKSETKKTPIDPIENAKK